MSSFPPKLTLRGAVIVLVAIVVLVLAGIFANYEQEVTALFESDRQSVEELQDVVADFEGHSVALPEILLERGIYPPGSFANEAGFIPAYWEGSKGNQTFKGGPTIGPCYVNRQEPTDWEAQIAKYNETGKPSYNIGVIMRSNHMDLEGYCRPGFLIIGAGKCGTSSLYHYITSHPKVLPANQKQIHYFRYHQNQPLKWYYQHFPSTASFLSAGALLTGEASPGYLPYPDVVIRMKERLPEPRLLAIGRNPIERAHSSYRYNYVDPLLDYLRTGKQKDIEKLKSDEFYASYIFTFEEMMKAELAVLKECFTLGSEGEQLTRNRWGGISWVQEEFQRREKEGLPPLIDLDGFCYGRQVDKKVYRRQWATLMAEQPKKIILNRNLHLTQAFIGRSLYLFPLEWWYTAFSHEHIYFICTEELKEFGGDSMNRVGQFLGLPRYENFSTVVQGGVFNVGNNKGYDKISTWGQLEQEHKENQIPLSDEFRLELEEFIKPYNERLFAMTGRRCNW